MTEPMNRDELKPETCLKFRCAHCGIVWDKPIRVCNCVTDALYQRGGKGHMRKSAILANLPADQVCKTCNGTQTVYTGEEHHEQCPDCQADQGQANGFDEWFDTSGRYLGYKNIQQALSAFKAGQARVVVKPLEWSTTESDRTIGIVASAESQMTKRNYLIVTHDFEFALWYADIDTDEKYETEEAAKAAAFAHHEAAVRSMIGGA